MNYESIMDEGLESMVGKSLPCSRQTSIALDICPAKLVNCVVGAWLVYHIPSTLGNNEVN